MLPNKNLAIALFTLSFKKLSLQKLQSCSLESTIIKENEVVLAHPTHKVFI